MSGRFIILKPGEKKPYSTDGHHLYIDDREELLSFVRRGFNVGTTGLHSLKLDWDDEARRLELFNHLGPLPLHVRTPSGGHHSYFLPEPEFGPSHIYDHHGEVVGEVKRKASEYCVCPPSRFEGTRYEWLVPIPFELEPLPESWRELLETNHAVYASSSKVNENPFEVPERIPKGLRHETVFAWTRSFKARGFSPEDALNVIAFANHHVRPDGTVGGIFHPPLDPHHLASEIRRAWGFPDDQNWRRR